MRNEQEYLFGRSLQQLVAHLIKNAIKVPEPILKGALDFEASAWDSQDAAAKRERVRAIADLTEARRPSTAIWKPIPTPSAKSAMPTI
jgi:hypothetical protein